MNRGFLRKARWLSALLAFIFLLFSTLPLYCQENTSTAGAKWYEDDDYLEEEETVSDPLEPMNRAFFYFNDKLYFWMVKPAARVYSYFLAEDVRMCVRDFFHNLTAPVRIVNNLLQGKLKNSGIETARFVINSTVGIVGLADPAQREFGLAIKDEDLGQTLAVYGVGSGIYICWPFFGPSNLRDTVGLIGDSFLSPLTYLTAADTAAGIGAKAGSHINDASLTIGDYEDFKAASLDPYLALRDAYRQYRKNKINDSATDNNLYSRNVWHYYVEKCRQKPEQAVFAAAGKQSPGQPLKDLFHIQVGTAIDPRNAQKLCLRLASLREETVVKVYDRESYSFYGIQVPAGDSFEAAKEIEQRLVEAGFPEAHVVN